MSKIHTEDQERTELPQRKNESQRSFDEKITCTECLLIFHGSYALRKQKQTLHQSQSQSNFTLSRKVDLDTTMKYHANQHIREALRIVEHFLVDSESICGKQHVFNLVLTELNPAVVAEKFRIVFANFSTTAKIIVTLCFVIHNIESSHYCY